MILWLGQVLLTAGGVVVAQKMGDEAGVVVGIVLCSIACGLANVRGERDGRAGS